jgi:RNA polymerase sigma factor (sigma-70 family)
MDSLRRFPPLKEEDELVLAKQIKDQEDAFRAVIVQWMRLFRKACRTKSISRTVKYNAGRFMCINTTCNLFAGLVRLDRQQKKITRALTQIPGSSQARRNLQEELCTVKAEIGKRIAEITLSNKWNRPMIRDLKKLFCRAGETNQQKRIRRELDRRLKEIDQSAQKIRALKTRMVQAHLRLVFSMAKKYSHHGLPLQDLIQEGNMGLMRAIDTFDYQRSPRFVTYAAWWIRQAFVRALNCKAPTIRKPVYINEKLCQINSAVKRLQKDCESSVSLAEIARDTNMPMQVIERVMQSFQEPLSLDASDGATGDVVMSAPQGGNAAPVLEQVVSCNLAQSVDKILSALPLREREIVQLRFGIGTTHDHTLEEIGKKFSLSRERIRQILEVALIKLRHSTQIIPLKEFMEMN